MEKIARITQLDALRGIAALLVIFFHFLPGHYIHLGTFPLGRYGVELFFAISGFLITYILLAQKEASIPVLIIYANFLKRRILRLFPIQYLVLIACSILTLFGHIFWKEGEWIYYYTYTTNILFYVDGLRSIQLNHLWTLAIEEQFYLFWPIILLVLPKRKEWILMIGLIIISVFVKLSTHHETIRFATYYHFDTLCGGALFAYFITYVKQDQNLSKSHWVGIWALLLLSTITLFFSSEGDIHFPVVISILSILLVILCFYKIRGPIGIIFNSKALQFVGKISYGLYLYHKFIPFYTGRLLEKIHIELSPLIMLLLCLFLTFIVAICSYYLIEKWFLSLKKSISIDSPFTNEKS